MWRRGDADRKGHGPRVRAPWAAVAGQEGRHAELERLEESSGENAQQVAG